MSMKTKKKHVVFGLLTAGILFNFFIPMSATAGTEFITLTYHDVVDSRDELTNDAVTTDHLVGHFEWLKVNRYNPISIDDLEAARSGIRPLPDNPVLLSWDDAYVSFYTHVLPLLRAYNYSAVLAIVGSWMAPESGEFVQYGRQQVPRGKFMSWEQLQETHDSGLVDIASHSYNLHKGILSNQFGDRIPATNARKFDPATSRYETDRQYRQRIRDDLQASSDQIFQHLGFRPRVMVWPYGHYNKIAVDIAAEIGMSITLTLDPAFSDIEHLQETGRVYLTQNPDIMAFRSYFHPEKHSDVKRFFRVDSQDLLEPYQEERQSVNTYIMLNASFNPVSANNGFSIENEPFSFRKGWLDSMAYKHNAAKRLIKKEPKFDKFISRIKNLDPGMVIIDPVVTRKSGREALFMNSRIPVAQDRMNRICWHTGKNAGVPISLWLSSELFVPSERETRDTVNRFFSDMGKFAPVRGLVVNSPELIEALLETVGNEPEEQRRTRFWSPSRRRRARQDMIEQRGNRKVAKFLQPLESFQQWQPFLEVSPVLSMKDFLSMELKQFGMLLRLFDFLIVDIGENSVENLKDLFGRKFDLLHNAEYLRQCAFLLSAEKKGDLARELYQLPELNIINWGYQFDNFLEDIPRADIIRPLISKRNFPYPLSD